MASPGYFFVALVGMVASFVVISSVIACLLTLSRRTSLYMNCIEIPFILLCGMAFPVDILPAWLQSVSRCLAPTWAVELLRMTVQGVTDAAAFWRGFGVLTLLSAALAVLSAWLYRVIDRAVRINASLEVC